MPKSCFAPNCTSGYRSNPVKVSLFKVPSEESRLEKWKRVIPRADRILSSKDYLCARHFEDHCIVRTFKPVATSGSTIMGITKVRSRLTKEAIPTLWPDCRLYSTVPVKSPKKKKALEIVQQSQQETECHQTYIIVEASETDGNFILELKAESNIWQAAVTSNSFAYLWENVADVTLPGSGWAKHAIESQGTQSVIFNELIVTGTKRHAITRKQVVFDNLNGIHVYVYNKSVDINPILSSNENQTSSVKTAEDLLQVFHAANICAGGPSILEFPECHLQCVFKDATDKWRHKKCLLMSQMTVCDYCRSVSNALRNIVIKHKTSSSSPSSTDKNIDKT